MNKLFDLKLSDDAPDNLFCEWGQGFCCIAAHHAGSGKITSLTYYTFEHPAGKDTVNAVVAAIKNLPVINKYVFSLAFPSQTMIPVKYSDREFVQTIYETSNLFNDRIPEWQVINQYSIPEYVNNAIKNNFQPAECFHSHTCSLKKSNSFQAAEQLLVNFTPLDFSVVVKRSGKLLLTQIYRYTAPLDVVYYLLKIISEFNLSSNNLLLVISGLIEENSALYRELHQYFLNIEFAKPEERFNTEHPPHFFTSVLNLAACVS